MLPTATSPSVLPQCPGEHQEQRSLTKLPYKLDQKKETQGPFVTHKGALGAGVGSVFAGTTLSGPPMQALWDPAANQSLQHTTA